MSLLKKIAGHRGSQFSLSPAEAIAAIAVAAIAVDGYLLDAESQRTIWLLSQLKLFQGYSEQRLTKMLDKLFNTLSDRGLDNLVAIASKSLHPEYRETAFSVATDLVLLNGAISGREQVFLTSLWQVLDISPDTASKILGGKIREKKAV